MENKTNEFIVLSFNNYKRNVCQISLNIASISEIRKNFEKLCKKFPNKLVGRDSRGLYLKNSLIIRVIYYKNFLSIWHFNVLGQNALYLTKSDFFLILSPSDFPPIKLSGHFLHNFIKLLHIF